LLQTVLSGGSTDSVTVVAYGEQDVSGGTTTGSVVASGGAQYVFAGTASGTLISSGGYQYDYGNSVSATVLAGGEEDVSGVASATVVSSGGLLFIESGATVTGGTVSNGGALVIDGGMFSGTLASGALEIYEVVSSGATVTGETITSGLDQTVLAGGSTLSATIAAYGEQDVTGGTTTGTLIASAGAQFVYAGTASSTVISAGGYQDVYDTTSVTLVSSGGVQIVESGAAANSTTVLAGGEIVVYYGASVSGLTVSNGGTELLLSSGQVFTEGAMMLHDAASASDTAQSTNIDALIDKDSASPPPVEVTVQHLIQAMATFDATRPSEGALFESVSGGAVYQEAGTLAHEHHSFAKR
jgi:autotransporter passenger strand-loop-strand repeat protein